MVIRAIVLGSFGVISNFLLGVPTLWDIPRDNITGERTRRSGSELNQLAKGRICRSLMSHVQNPLNKDLAQAKS